MAGPLAHDARRPCQRSPTMITKAEITRRASQDGVSARTVEKDYIQAHIVAAIAGLNEGSKLVFKGGTALRLCHFESYRYSADLDFSVTSPNSKITSPKAYPISMRLSAAYLVIFDKPVCCSFIPWQAPLISSQVHFSAQKRGPF